MYTYEEKVQLGIELVQNKEKMQWAIGDLAATIMQDDTVTTDLNLAKFAPEIGLSPRTLQGYVKLAKFWPVDLRDNYPNLGYSHFKTAMAHAGGDLDRAIRLMDIASSNGLTIAQFEQHAKELRQDRISLLTDLLARAHGILVGVLGQGEILDEIESALGLRPEAV